MGAPVLETVTDQIEGSLLSQKASSHQRSANGFVGP
jgi:hypothetical protein